MKIVWEQLAKSGFKILTCMILTLGLLSFMAGSGQATLLAQPLDHTLSPNSVEQDSSSLFDASDIAVNQNIMSNSSASSTFADLTAQELRERYTEMVLIDVRTGPEFRWKHIPGSLKLSRQEILQQVPRNKAIGVICLSGHRSIPMAKWLAGQGYDQVYNLKGGFWSWWRSGYPTE